VPPSPRPKQRDLDQKIDNPNIAQRGGRYLLDFEEIEKLGKGGEFLSLVVLLRVVVLY
jgi:hypothetical protein